MNIQELIALLQGNVNSNSKINIDVTINNINTADTVADDLPDTDFDMDDEVLVCHIRKNGERVHTVGRVIEVCGQDDKGYYTRVEGANGKHYRAGLKYNEERLGTVIYQLDM
jgi:hypothetical protein